MFYKVSDAEWFADHTVIRKLFADLLFSKFAVHTAAIITVFLVIHLLDFYFKAKIFEMCRLFVMKERYLFWEWSSEV
jgi:hypothetical protein